MAVKVEPVFDAALKMRLFSGASLLAASSETLFFRKTWGHTRHGGGPVDHDTWFDLASLTKPLVTASLCIRAVSENRLQLEDAVTRFLPRGAAPRDKKDITVGHLLNHASGLPAHEDFYLDLIRVPPAGRADALLNSILSAPLTDPPGKTARYSDLGFMLLGWIIETVFHGPLDRLARELLWKPAGAADLLDFRRIDASVAPEAAAPPGGRDAEGGKDHLRFVATEQCPWRGRLLQGEVHDENAFSMGGVAGHAGLFGTAEGVFRWLSFLRKVYRGEAADSGPSGSWSPSVVKAFWERKNMISGSTWALGFDTPSEADSSAGVYFSPNSVGHLGFTGTSFWMDLEKDVLVVLLTNRVHPTRANSGIKEFRPAVHNLIMEALHATTN